MQYYLDPENSILVKELMASNRAFNTDESDACEEWIELYNDQNGDESYGRCSASLQVFA